MGTVEITAEHPGLIPAGAKLIYRSGTLEMVGTHFLKTAGKRIRVHPLTMVLPAQSVEVLDQHPEVPEWQLLSYTDGTAVLRPLSQEQATPNLFTK